MDLGPLRDWLRCVEMLVMTGKQEMQLIAPLILAAVFFVFLLVLARLTGDLNRYTWKALLAAAGLGAYALYLTMWQNEIGGLWHSFPLVVVFGVLLSLLAPCGLFYWIWRVQAAAKAEKIPVTSQNIKPVSGFTRVFRRIVLVWGALNLLGLLIAVIYSFFRKP